MIEVTVRQEELCGNWHAHAKIGNCRHYFIGPYLMEVFRQITEEVWASIGNPIH